MAYLMTCTQLQICSELMASLCSRIVVKVQRQPDAFKHTVLHMHSVHCSPAVASAVWPSDGQQCINTHKPLSCIVQQLV